MRFEGKLKSWNDERGFGFIDLSKGVDEIFVHIKSFPAGTGRLSVDLLLTFEVEQGPKGKKRAQAVQLLAAAFRRPEACGTWTVARVLAVPAFISVYLLVAARWPVSSWVAAFYGIASLVAFVAYALDKSAARHGRWRTPESTLHGLGLVGGWPGALLAQQLLRHKSSKPSFVAAFWATVCWLCSCASSDG